LFGGSGSLGDVSFVARDTQIVRMRNAWREANGREALPLPERPVHEAENRQPNVVSSLKWGGGAPLAGIQIMEGEPLNPDGFD